MTSAAGHPTLEGVKQRTLRFATVLAAILACTLVSSTSFALYRTSMGPKQCCASHCRHAMPQRAAERCCQLHATVAPGTVGNVAQPDAMPVALLPFVATPLAAAPTKATSATAFRGPPSDTLVTQHTSLTL